MQTFIYVLYALKYESIHRPPHTAILSSSRSFEFVLYHHRHHLITFKKNPLRMKKYIKRDILELLNRNYMEKIMCANICI